MDDIYKKALKRAFLEQILPQELINAKIFKDKEDVFISINDKEEVKVVISPRLLASQEQLTTNIINYLASKLADVKVELWLKTQLKGN